MAAAFGFYLYHSLPADTAPQANIQDPLFTPVASFQHIVHDASLTCFVSRHSSSILTDTIQVTFETPGNIVAAAVTRGK